MRACTVAATDLAVRLFYVVLARVLGQSQDRVEVLGVQDLLHQLALLRRPLQPHRQWADADWWCDTGGGVRTRPRLAGPSSRPCVDAWCVLALQHLPCPPPEDVGGFGAASRRRGAAAAALAQQSRCGAQSMGTAQPRRDHLQTVRRRRWRGHAASWRRPSCGWRVPLRSSPAGTRPAAGHDDAQHRGLNTEPHGAAVQDAMIRKVAQVAAFAYFCTTHTHDVRASLRWMRRAVLPLTQSAPPAPGRPRAWPRRPPPGICGPPPCWLSGQPWPSPAPLSAAWLAYTGVCGEWVKGGRRITPTTTPAAPSLQAPTRPPQSVATSLD